MKKKVEKELSKAVVTLYKKDKIYSKKIHKLKLKLKVYY